MTSGKGAVDNGGDLVAGTGYGNYLGFNSTFWDGNAFRFYDDVTRRLGAFTGSTADFKGEFCCVNHSWNLPTSNSRTDISPGGISPNLTWKRNTSSCQHFLARSCWSSVGKERLTTTFPICQFCLIPFFNSLREFATNDSWNRGSE